MREGINIFVDGASATNGSGIGIVCSELNYSNSYKLLNRASSHQVERMAILKASELLTQLKPDTDKPVYIWSDSLSAVNSFKSPATTNKAECDCGELINAFIRDAAPEGKVILG